jgi:hypothetical protein
MSRWTHIIRFVFFYAAYGVLCLTADSPKAPAAATARPEAVNGYLVDMVCVREEAAHLSELGPKHTTKCLKMPACRASGYALLLPSSEVLQFDERGNQLAAKLIEATHREGDWRMRATGKRDGDHFLVKTLELEKAAAPARKTPGRK